MNTNIGDLPEALLVDILGRLPCYKYIARGKCVSKRWCAVMSHPSFIRRFLCFQSVGKQTFMTRTLISCKGEEFLPRMSLSFKPLTPLFRRLMNFHQLKEEPIVVPLPPPPQVTELTGAGIFCDLPFYKCKKSDLGGCEVQINAEYRCRVVRIIFHRVSEMYMPPCQLKVQIFSPEIGVWRESIVSSPTRFEAYSVSHRGNIALNEMLYWLSIHGDFLIGLDPFMMDNRNRASVSCTSSSLVDGHASDRYEFLYTKIDGYKVVSPGFLGVYEGCLQIGDYKYSSHAVHAWELHNDIHSGSGKLCLGQRKMVYSLPLEIGPYDDYYVDLVCFDPNNEGSEGEGILYLYVVGCDDKYGDILMWNISTGKFSKIYENHPWLEEYFTVAVPLWPTPVP